jgi:26S proteasome regulatory subunit N2
MIGVNESPEKCQNHSQYSQTQSLPCISILSSLKKEEGKEKEKVETAVLSTTAKVKARVGRKNKAEGAVEAATPNPDKEMADEEKKKKEEEEIKALEPDFQELKNPSRVLKA